MQNNPKSFFAAQRSAWLWTLGRRIGLVPIWLLALALKPFLPAAHPWKHQPMTLQSWWDFGTENAVAFGWCFIVQGGFLLWLAAHFFA